MGIMTEGIVSALKLIISFDPEVVSITLLSLRVSLSAVIISTLIALPLAALIAFNRFWGKRLLLNVIHTFMGLPPVVVGLSVYLIISRQGFLGPFELLYTPTAMIIAQVILVVPIIMGVSISAMDGVNRQKRETMLTLGASKMQLVMRTIVEAKRSIITSVVTGLGRALAEVGAIIIVGGNIRYHTRALTTAIVLETRRGNFALAIALGIILLAMAFTINFILTSIQQRKDNE